MERLKNGFFLTVGVLFILGCFYLFLKQPAPAKYQQGEPVITAGGNVIPVEVADSENERTRGLSDREALAGGHGLLFEFPEVGSYGFWMKDMRFPIDIVWINEDWTVVGVERNATPESFPEIFYPAAPIKYVLEINSGEAEKFSIEAGRKLDFGYRN